MMMMMRRSTTTVDKDPAVAAASHLLQLQQQRLPTSSSLELKRIIVVLVLLGHCCSTFLLQPLLGRTTHSVITTVDAFTFASTTTLPTKTFTLAHAAISTNPSSSTETETPIQDDANKAAVDPLLIRAARGEANIERTPVWMMRQAGRHIAEYRALCQQYPTFRQRSEITEVAVEVSLQPWRNYQTDGCILFSDILTPLPGMGCDFIIDDKKGPIMSNPIRTYDDLKQVNDDVHWMSLCCFLLLLLFDGSLFTHSLSSNFQFLLFHQVT
jgi:Uroporphyrinogen decarboxylase (URO-D)